MKRLVELPRPFSVAHRAGNRLAVLARAERAGVDLVEADIWYYRERLEVRHERTVGPLPLYRAGRFVRPAPWSRLTVPRLLREFDAGTLVMFDLKGDDPALPDTLVREFRRTRPYDELLVCSQNWTLLDRFAAHAGVTRVHSIGHVYQLTSVWERLAHAEHDAVSIDWRILNPELMRKLKELVATVMTWTVNTPTQLEMVLNLGVDGVVSDDLTLLDRVVARRHSTDRQ